MDKPRRTIGTPVYKIRNQFALGTIAIGVLCGIVYNFSSLGNRLKKDIREGRFSHTPEEIDRRNLISVISTSRGSSIKEHIELKQSMESR